MVYWKCEAGQVLKENLTIPIINPAREKALMLASQQVGSVLFYFFNLTVTLVVVCPLSVLVGALCF